MPIVRSSPYIIRAPQLRMTLPPSPRPAAPSRPTSPLEALLRTIGGSPAPSTSSPPILAPAPGAGLVAGMMPARPAGPVPAAGPLTPAAPSTRPKAPKRAPTVLLG